MLATAEQRRRWRWPPSKISQQAGDPQVKGGEGRDPEFVKNLRIFGRLIDGAVDRWARAEPIAVESEGTRATEINDEPDSLAGQPDARLARQPRAREESLCNLVTLPEGFPLTLKVLLGRRFALEQLLIEVGDECYLASRLAELYSEQHATSPTWQDLFGDQVPPLLPGPVHHPQPQPALAADQIETTRQRLARLMHVKEYEDQYRQARGELLRRTAIMAAVVLSVAVLGFATAVAFLVNYPRAPLAAAAATAAAGATGAALGGLIKLRDQVYLGSQIRRFRPFFLGQVVIGAAAGLVTFLVVQAHIITISGPPGVGAAALAFAVGFSEAAFVGLLGRLTGAVGEPDKEKQARPPAS